jgi:integrase
VPRCPARTHHVGPPVGDGAFVGQLGLKRDRVTPHTFRRTYVTYLAWAGVPARREMSQAGHKDAKLTLQVYQQDFPDDPPALAQVKGWLRID